MQDAYLSVADVKAAKESKPLEIEQVTVPEWGNPEKPDPVVNICELDGEEFDQFQIDAFGSESPADGETRITGFRHHLLAHALRDGDRRRIFQSTEDVDALGKMGAKTIARLFTIASRLNGLDKDEISQIAGNSRSPAKNGSG